MVWRSRTGPHQPVRGSRRPHPGTTVPPTQGSVWLWPCPAPLASPSLWGVHAASPLPFPIPEGILCQLQETARPLHPHPGLGSRGNTPWAGVHYAIQASPFSTARASTENLGGSPAPARPSRSRLCIPVVGNT